MTKNFLNPEGHQNPIIGAKVTAILLKGLILPIGGVALGRVCAAGLFSWMWSCCLDIWLLLTISLFFILSFNIQSLNLIAVIILLKIVLMYSVHLNCFLSRWGQGSYNTALFYVFSQGCRDPGPFCPPKWMCSECAVWLSPRRERRSSRKWEKRGIRQHCVPGQRSRRPWVFLKTPKNECQRTAGHIQE